jgi:DNA adenine methylase
VRYLGGKSRIAKPIAAIVDAVALAQRAIVIEPFCGALSVTAALTSPRIASDACLPLITLYRALRAGWTPPDSVDRALYDRVKATRDPNDPLTAFVGFGCSYGGKWFAGLDRGYRATRGDCSAANEAARMLRAKIAACADVPITHRDYRDHAPDGDIVYCDPPYASTTAYTAAASFDSAAFWSTARTWSTRAIVLVSEYAAPPDFVEVWSKTRQVLVGGSGDRIERLFVHRGHAGAAFACLQ